jgi:chromosome segregation ATPase
MERRLAQMEQLERRLAQVEQAKAMPPPFDQKVLEAVVNALDARLKEQASALDRRVAELEAKLAAELKALRQQDHAIASAVETHMEELQNYFIAQVEAVRQQVEENRATMHEEVAAAVKNASESAIEESLGPVRAEAAAKDREIAELRRKAEESDCAMLELLNGIGEVVRQAASRTAPAPPAPVAPAEPAPTPEGDGVAGVEEGAPIPAFAQAGKPGRLWRVPLVSSMMVATFGLIMVHYL